MELLLHQLEDNLNQAVELYEDLLQITRGKQEAIVCADLDGLEQALHAERELIDSASRLESLRQRLHYAISRQLGIAPEELKLSRLYTQWPFHDTSGLQEAHSRLKTILQELKHLSDTNQYLADISLKLVKEIRNAVFHSSEEDPCYGRTGLVQSVPQDRLLVDVAG